MNRKSPAKGIWRIPKPPGRGHGQQQAKSDDRVDHQNLYQRNFSRLDRIGDQIGQILALVSETIRALPAAATANAPG
ncbi:MAG UNVERIFIED_CONTAM: hypothetical protein LVR29_23860, partial [Microcystis novacekii LVE1205-3]